MLDLVQVSGRDKRWWGTPLLQPLRASFCGPSLPLLLVVCECSSPEGGSRCGAPAQYVTRTDTSAGGSPAADLLDIGVSRGA